MSRSDQSPTTANAVIRADGQIEIISGGAACYKCGKPTMTCELADPFGKSDMMRWVCNDCTQYPTCVGLEMPVDQSPTADILARIKRELAHPIMRHSGSGEVEEETLLDAAAEIGRLREALLAVQRSAFDAGYDAARDGRPRLDAYAEWSNQ